MAEELVYGEFWLPSEFLTDDDILLDMDLASLSTEPETDEDDIHFPGSSPKSTLFGFDQGSNLSTPILPISPPKKRFMSEDKSATLDLLNKAAGEVAKMTSVGTGFFDCSNTAKRPVYPPTANPAPFYYSHPQFRVFPPHLMWEGVRFSAPPQENKVAKNNSNNGLLGLPPTAWPPLLGQVEPPTQPKFVAPKRDSVGTGVFFPRRVPSNSDPQKISDEKVMKTKKNKGTQQINSHPANAIHEEIELPSEWIY